MTNKEDAATSLAIVVIVLACFALVAIAGCAGTTRQSCEVRYELPADGKAVAVVQYKIDGGL